jgi:sugar lactone lactonase YvrE
VSYDATVFDETHHLEIRQHEFAWFDLSGRPPAARPPAASPVVAEGARVERLAGGFLNIAGGAVGPQGDYFFVDAQSNRIYRWTVSSRKLSTVSDRPLSPVNLLADQAGNLLIVSSGGDGTVYALTAAGDFSPLRQEPVTARPGARLYLPVSDWRLNRNSLSSPAAHFVSPDGTAVLPVGADFLRGATSWGVKSSPPIRSFGLARAISGQPFYVSEEAAISTWVADVAADGRLRNFRWFADQGSESVAVDSQGHVFLAAGQIYVYQREGKLLDTIEVPERPVQLVFGGADGRTLFIAARSSLYSLAVRLPGR